MDGIRKINGLLSYHFHIPFPEDLPDDLYWEKWEQLKWVLQYEDSRAPKLQLATTTR